MQTSIGCLNMDKEAGACEICVSQFHGRHNDSLRFGVVVLELEAVSGQCKFLHLEMIEGTDGVDVGTGSKLFQLVSGFVQVEDVLDAEVVVAHVVLVLEDAECSVDLILVSHSL